MSEPQQHQHQHQHQQQQQQPPIQNGEESRYTSDPSEMSAEDFVARHCLFAPDSDQDELDDEPVLQKNTNKNNNMVGEGSGPHPQQVDSHADNARQNPAEIPMISRQENNQSPMSLQFEDHPSAEDEHSFSNSEDSAYNGNRDNLVPLEFAQTHITRIESDMARMHERHVNLMKEMDTNYKLIEQETQEYYIEFLQKWRELAKNKISQYRRQSETLLEENKKLEAKKQIEVGALNSKLHEAEQEKRRLMHENKQDIIEREEILNRIQISNEEQILRYESEQKLLRQENSNLKQQNETIKNQLETLKNELNKTQTTLATQREQFESALKTQRDGFESKLQSKPAQTSLKITGSQEGATNPTTIKLGAKQQFRTISANAAGSSVAKNTDTAPQLKLQNLGQRIKLGSNQIQPSLQNQKDQNNLNTQPTPQINLNPPSNNQTQQSTISTVGKEGPVGNAGIISKKLNFKRPVSQTPGHSELDTKIADLQKKQKELLAIIKPWQDEQKKLNEGKTVKLKKSDPIYPDYQKYLGIQKELKELLNQKTNRSVSPMAVQPQQVISNVKPVLNLPNAAPQMQQPPMSIVDNSELEKLRDEIKSLKSENTKLEQKLKVTIEEAQKGIKQRDEVLHKRKKLISKLEQDTKMQVEQKTVVENQLVILRKEYQQGEEIFVTQLRQLETSQQEMKTKLEFEQLARKRLHNQIEDMKGKIRVFCRVRPLSQMEKDKGSLPVVTLLDQYTVKIRVKQQSNLNNSTNQDQSQIFRDEEYTFDSCFGGHSTQTQIFEDCQMLMQSALDGFNVCLFAYGQTGSGKTYTIQGSEVSGSENRGLVPRGIEELFRLKEQRMVGSQVQVNFECYMVELYLDQLHDLLADQSQTKRLELREDPPGMIQVLGVRKQQINSLDEALHYYNIGCNQRRTSSTNMNDASSRSHFVFTLLATVYNVETQQTSTSKISFVDLAGSERVSRSNPTIQQLKETKSINGSLSALKDVIRALSSGQGNQFVPYRNNKLTHLMRDSIGGNSKTLMFVNISPADINAQESKMSLFFGQDVKQIRNEVKRNVEGSEVIRLRDENTQLKRQLGIQ